MLAFSTLLPILAHSAPEKLPPEILPVIQGGREPWEEHAKHIKARNAVAAVGTDGFGDAVNLYTGALSFAMTDISLPGNSGLPVELKRSYSVGVESRLPFGDWDLDVPRISGVYPPHWPSNRCSATTAPRDGNYTSLDYWQGLTAEMPGGGELLVADSSVPRPANGTAYVWLTSSNTYFECMPNAANGGGEGFRAITRDGTTYLFTWMASYDMEQLARPINTGSPDAALIRRRNVLYATQVTDRFGHWVKYHYSNAPHEPARLTRIEADDGRLITIAPNPDGTIHSASSHGRTWIYGYDAPTQTHAGGSLNSVLLPDFSQWTINLKGLTDEIELSRGDPSDCDSRHIKAGTSAPLIGHLTHPAGATATFELRPIFHGRTRVPKLCVNHSSPNNDPNDDFAVYARSFLAQTLVSKTVTGPSVVPVSWTYQYFGGAGSWASSPDAPLCTTESCAGRKRTMITSSAGDWQRYTFGNTYRYDEGKLLMVERGYSESQIQRTETTSYNLAHTDPQFAARMGSSNRPRGDGFASEYPRPPSSRVISRHYSGGQTDTFTWSVSDFDSFARPRKVVRSSSLGTHRTELTEYRDNLNRWVLGQVAKVTFPKTGPGVPSNPLIPNDIVAEETTFDPEFDLPASRFEFGRLSTRTVYHTKVAQRALPRQLFDGSNVKHTTLDLYHRGLPQSVVFHDATQLSAVVNDRGELTSVTDQLGNPTCYEFDLMGRVEKIWPPSESIPGTCETNPSAATSIRFAPIASNELPEYGFTALNWRRTETTGSAITQTFYDGLWRPLLEVQSSAAGQRAAVRRIFDHENREVLVTYPVDTLAETSSYTTLHAGISTHYDAIGRVSGTSATAEQGIGTVSTATQYLSGLRTVFTNARGYQTTTTHQAFDQPSYDSPVLVQALEPSDPNRQTTTFDRDTFGKPLAITRSGNYAETQLPPLANINESLSTTRHFVYDAHQRLCKRIDPESGASVLAYDASNNLAWSADGLNRPALTCESSVPADALVSRTYDNLNRLTRIDYPDSTDDVVMTYHPDGALKTADVGTGPAAILRAYGYNHRRQLRSETLQVDGQIFTLGYDYNLLGHLTHLSYPDGGSESLNPDAFGRPTGVGNFASNVSYHPGGAIAGFRYGNQVWFAQALNTRQLPSERRDYIAGTIVQRSVYTYDRNGNLTQDLDTEGDPGQFLNATRTLGYDGLDRLTVANSASQVRNRWQWGYGWGEARFSYDPLDNVRRGVLGPLSFSYQYQDQGRLSFIDDQSQEPSPDFVYSYTPRGQVSSRSLRRGPLVTEHFSMTWDSAHRMLSSHNLSTGASESYRYDAHGHRVRSQSGSGIRWQMYSQAGNLMFERESGSGKVNKYGYLGGQRVGEIISGKYQALHTDNVGTLRKKTDATNIVVMEDIRAPYGSVMLGWDYHDGPAYAGHVEDMSSGLTYMKARYYDPVAMRFMSPDPVDVSAANGGNFNRYWYANNNPYRFTDPDGRESLAIRAMERDIESFERGDMSQEEFDANNAARAGGVVVGAAVLAGARSPAAVTGILRIFSARSVPAAYRAAAEGGRHAGFLRQQLGKTPSQLQKTIRNIERRIEEHRQKIRNPERHMSRDEINPQTIERARKDWAGDISRQTEQRDIAREVLKKMTCTGSRIPGNC